MRLDMSEYQERHTVSRLLGAPPGYIGYDEGGQLTEAVRRKPYSVVLFDEIEKAHPDVFNTLLQVLDDGRITDAQGRTVDFRNTVIIMTSNIGSHHLLDGVTPYGEIKPEARTAVMAELGNTSGRSSSTASTTSCCSPPCAEREIERIVDLQFDQLRNRLAEQGSPSNSPRPPASSSRDMVSTRSTGPVRCAGTSLMRSRPRSVGRCSAARLPRG